ncbi:hypothetical protein [Elizabethkingia meningoseptica]|nr:hypothetical protein [Elizabethkingia meningoseptica]MDE5493532.1 hypothetical protein [Elizabethkingia meningoseptica]
MKDHLKSNLEQIDRLLDIIRAAFVSQRATEQDLELIIGTMTEVLIRL